MTEPQFVKNHRGIDQGADLPQDLLEGMYRRIQVRTCLLCRLALFGFVFCLFWAEVRVTLVRRVVMPST